MDDILSTVINNWLDRGLSNGAYLSKDDQENGDFSKTYTIKTEVPLSETHYARIKHGLRPKAIEDKWYAYFDDGRINFLRSWTGHKIYEAEIRKSETDYLIAEIIVERDASIYSCVVDEEDTWSFRFLLVRGILGYDVKRSHNHGSVNDALKDWSTFGNLTIS